MVHFQWTFRLLLQKQVYLRVKTNHKTNKPISFAAPNTHTHTHLHTKQWFHADQIRKIARSQRTQLHAHTQTQTEIFVALKAKFRWLQWKPQLKRKTTIDFPIEFFFESQIEIKNWFFVNATKCEFERYQNGNANAKVSLLWFFNAQTIKCLC